LGAYRTHRLATIHNVTDDDDDDDGRNSRRGFRGGGVEPAYAPPKLATD